MPTLATAAWSVGAVVLAWLAGLGMVGIAWPARVALPWLAWAGLGGLLGSGLVGLAFMACGAVGVSSSVALPVVGVAATGVGALGAWRRRRLPRHPVGSTRHAVASGIVLALAIAWTGSLALRTHLGWDGTVVWYHKARVLAATGGVMPATTLSDRTRGWIAPDYPLHVPLAMAWVRAWQPVEDERAAKLLQVGWCAAILCLLAAAVRPRSMPDRGDHVRVAAAVLLVATTARLVVGEGSLTSGYADGVVAGLLLALLWLAQRSDWGADRRWTLLMATVALLLAWTKQEGVVAVVATAALMARGGHRASAAWVSAPALALTMAWNAHVWVAGAPTGIAYEWQGVATAAGRLMPVVAAYAREWAAWGTWGVFWPVVTVMALGTARASGTWRVLAVVAALTTTGAMAFLFSDWPDVREHLAVTVPRQWVQIAPVLVWCACGMGRER